MMKRIVKLQEKFFILLVSIGMAGIMRFVSVVFRGHPERSAGTVTINSKGQPIESLFAGVRPPKKSAGCPTPIAGAGDAGQASLVPTVFVAGLPGPKLTLIQDCGDGDGDGDGCGDGCGDGDGE